MTGRPSKWSEELEQKAWDYVNGGWQDECHTIPSHAGLCVILEVHRDTLYEWAKHDDKCFSDILHRCNQIQELTLLNGSLNNTLNSNISKLVLGKHGYQDKQEVSQDITTGGKPVNNWTVNPVTTNKDG
jgi:hypothetical protein